MNLSEKLRDKAAQIWMVTVHLEKLKAEFEAIKYMADEVAKSQAAESEAAKTKTEGDATQSPT